MNSNFIETKIANFCVHKIGNKVADEGCFLSKNTLLSDKKSGLKRI